MKSKYETAVKPKLDVIEGWARNGLTLEDIAHNLGIAKTSLITYKKKHKELADAIECGKEVADIRVENALYKRAVGFTQTEKRYIKCKNEDGSDEVREVEEEITYQPDVTAIIYWLKNRKPDKWRDKVIPEEVVEDIVSMLQITERREKNEAPKREEA